VGERPGVSRLGVKEKEGATGGWRGRRGRGRGYGGQASKSGAARFSVERKGETANTKCYGRKIGAKGRGEEGVERGQRMRRTRVGIMELTTFYVTLRCYGRSLRNLIRERMDR